MEEIDLDNWSPVIRAAGNENTTLYYFPTKFWLNIGNYHPFSFWTERCEIYRLFLNIHEKKIGISEEDKRF